VSLPFTDDAQVKQVSDTVSALLVDNKHITDTSSIVGSALNGPSVSQYMSDTALTAVIIGLLLIALYMMITFASMRKHISPMVLAAIALVTMVFDISIPMGVYAVWMHINPTITVDTIFIIAILTTM
jgi:preprotein translocase subunit SecF